MNIKSSNSSVRNSLQTGGIWLSVLCGIHCAALPVILLLAPALSSGIANHLWMDALVLMGILAIGILTIGMDYHQKHKEKLVVIAFAAGIALIVSGHMLEVRWLEITTAILGGALLAGSQYYSLRLSRKKSSSPTD